MDQPSVISLPMDSSTAPTPPDGMPLSQPNTAASATQSALSLSRQHPIPPASEPRQYRAIGLIHGVYTPTEEQFTRGMLITTDGTAIDAVLLGRVMSLIKKHVDLDQPHLWVVYPRTREKNYDLHAQIVGIWEPDNLAKTDDADVDGDAAKTLGQDEGPQRSAAADPAAGQTAMTAQPPAKPIATPPVKPPMRPGMPPATLPPLNDGFFSIRGEVLFHSDDDERLIVRIQQSPKKADQPEKAFKLILKGQLQGKTVGYFWDLTVQREGNLLVVQDATPIGLVPPRKKKAGDLGEGDRPRFKKPWKKPLREGDAPRSSRPERAPTPRPRDGREAPPKPTRRVDRTLTDRNQTDSAT